MVGPVEFVRDYDEPFVHHPFALEKTWYVWIIFIVTQAFIQTYIPKLMLHKFKDGNANATTVNIPFIQTFDKQFRILNIKSHLTIPNISLPTFWKRLFFISAIVVILISVFLLSAICWPIAFGFLGTCFCVFVLSNDTSKATIYFTQLFVFGAFYLLAWLSAAQEIALQPLDSPKSLFQSLLETNFHYNLFTEVFYYILLSYLGFLPAYGLFKKKPQPET
jgi:hypothetical protein